ncbi:hypothetical protein [Halomicrobium sp. LC1Hm]|uniref:hypothetical protein n=1 Tax=Halomicrobium sp. LC1Hm TaxID=2610902 RepID=UPI0012983DD7|nr:hypothetical protein [Halomicrobium sp. LC1Hm]
MRDIEADNEISLPVLPEDSDQLGDRVYQCHLNVEKVIENNGYESSDGWHITNPDIVERELETAIQSIVLVNLFTKVLRFAVLGLFLSSLLISIYVGLFGLNSLVNTVLSVTGNSTSKAALIIWS